MKEGIDTLFKNKSAKSILQTLDFVERDESITKLIGSENEDDE